MSELTRKTAAELSALLHSGEVSSQEVTQAHLDRIAAVEPEVHAFLSVNESALDAAKTVDEKRAAGASLHALAGVPLAVKDAIVTTEMPSTAGSRMLEGYRSPFDATVIEKAREAGLVLLGKTNMDEFGMGSSTENSAFGASRNPWNTAHVPGGSSGGSAAATAAFEAPFALGSDTGGSIRQPAALTGIVGMKPTYGAVSRYGAIGLASSLDQIGSLGRTVLDTALLQDLIVGTDPRDANSLDRDWQSMAQATREGAESGSLAGQRVGVITQLQGEGTQPGVREQFDRTISLLTNAGATVVEVDLPELEHAVAAYYLIMSAEASSNLAKFDAVRFGVRVTPENGPATSDSVMTASRTAGFGAEVKRRIILGTYVLSAGHYDRLFRNALKARTRVIRAFERAFGEVDLLIAPTSPFTAKLLGQQQSDPLSTYLADATTIPASLAGLPGISVPVGLAAEDGLPVGVQLLAPTTEDARVFTAAAALESLVTDRDGAPFWSTVPTLTGKASE